MVLFFSTARSAFNSFVRHAPAGRSTDAVIAANRKDHHEPRRYEPRLPGHINRTMELEKEEQRHENQIIPSTRHHYDLPGGDVVVVCATRTGGRSRLAYGYSPARSPKRGCRYTVVVPAKRRACGEGSIG